MNMTNAEKLRIKQEEKVVALFADRKFKRIQLNLLVTPETGIDSDTDLDEIDAELHAHGLLSPVSVCGPYADGTYKVIEGSRRIKALRKFLSADKIPCYIVDGRASDKRIKELALAANRVHRADDRSLNLSYAQLVFDEYMDDKICAEDMTRCLAGLAGMTTRQARKYIRIIQDGYDKVLDSVSDKSLQIDEAVAITQTYPDDEEMQEKMVEICIAAPNYKAKTDVIHEIKEGRGETLAKGNVKKNIEDLTVRKRLAEQVKVTEACLESIVGNPDLLEDGMFGHIRELCREVSAL